jgi:enoyl-CoA hydratase
MGFVTYEQDGYIGLITINRPEALNALNTQVLKDFDEVIDNIDLNETRVVVLTGAGEKSFVAGADIGAMSNMTKKEGREFGKFGNDIFRKFETLPIPTIAAVNGFALGGGNELALSCDIRYCSENAVFGQPEVGLGITPGFGGTQRLVRIVGVGKAKEMVFSGINIKADEAYRIGLVNGVCAKEELMPTVMKLAKKIASNAPIAVSKSKQSMTEGFLYHMDHAIALEEKYFSECFETEDQKEGMKAFLEKRKVEKFNNR